MIAMKQKSLEEIQKMIEGYKRVLLIACDGCAGIYEVGGLRQAELLASQLNLSKEIKKSGKYDLKTVTVPRQCDVEIVLNHLQETVSNIDAIVSLACGIGVQTLAEVFPDTPVFPANDTEFIGMSDKGMLYERCQACGQCILDQTGGICPIARCAKGLLNGPCGGQVEGKCEVGGYTNDCAWVLIYEKLKRQGRLDLFKQFRSYRELKPRPRELPLPMHPKG
jgi:hypothetical protein